MLKLYSISIPCTIDVIADSKKEALDSLWILEADQFRDTFLDGIQNAKITTENVSIGD